MEINWLKVHGHGNRRTLQEELQHTAAYRLPMSMDCYEFLCCCGVKLSFTGPWLRMKDAERREEFLSWWSALPVLDEPYDAAAMKASSTEQRIHQQRTLDRSLAEMKKTARTAIDYAEQHSLSLPLRPQLEALLAPPNIDIQAGGPSLKVVKVPCFEEYLSDKAKQIYAKRFQRTVLEVCSECGPLPACNGLHNSLADFVADTFGLAIQSDGRAVPVLRIEKTPERAAHDEKAVLSVRLCQYLGKTVPLNAQDSIDEIWVKRFAKIFNLLVEHTMVNYGVLCEAMMIPLAPPFSPERESEMLKTGRERTLQEKKPTRAMMLLYVFSDYDRDALNAFLQNQAFTLEGELPSDNWTNLPE